MHSKKRTKEPDFFPKLREKYHSYDELARREDDDARNDWKRVIRALRQEFDKICVYCERKCLVSPGPKKAKEWSDYKRGQIGQVEHFRPQSHFPDRSLEWDNLVYSCARCNQAKGNLWPGKEGSPESGKAPSVRIPLPEVEEYVSPNIESDNLPAHKFFYVPQRKGTLLAPKNRGDLREFSMAQRTISDIDINHAKSDKELYRKPKRDDFKIESYPPYDCERSLEAQRSSQLKKIRKELEACNDRKEAIEVIKRYTQPNQPYSGFIAAFFDTRIPGWDSSDS